MEYDSNLKIDGCDRRLLMKILALETANEQCSVALIDETQLLSFELNFEPRAQTQQILPMIDRALKSTETTWQEISAIAFSRGPGSFSGVRINAAVAQALAWTHDLPVVPVSTLRALAQHGYLENAATAITAVIDARMNEVYIGSFAVDEHGIMQACDAEQLLNYEQAQQITTHKITSNQTTNHQIITHQVIGTGAKLLGVDVESNLHYANAQDVAVIARSEFLQGNTVSADQALPVYLRDNAWKKIADQGKA